MFNSSHIDSVSEFSAEDHITLTCDPQEVWSEFTVCSSLNLSWDLRPYSPETLCHDIHPYVSQRLLTRQKQLACLICQAPRPISSGELETMTFPIFWIPIKLGCCCQHLRGASQAENWALFSHWSRNNELQVIAPFNQEEGGLFLSFL